MPLVGFLPTTPVFERTIDNILNNNIDNNNYNKICVDSTRAGRQKGK
jgi:hypothetical protein